MLRIPGMPLLPGTLFREVNKVYYPKSQTLLNFRGIPMLSDRQNSMPVDPAGVVVDISCPPANAHALYPPRTGPHLPPWLAYDKKVLSFKAYFKQTLQENFHAPYMVRHVKLYYYLEDGTVEIHEPKVKNSGIVQGCVLHRQRVPKPPPCDNEFLAITDLNVDTTVQIFDRFYHIYDCDPFTRTFLNKRGIVVPDPVMAAVDPSEAVRNRVPARASNPPEKKHPFAQFLKYDRQVLKFQAYWDDRTDMGDVRKLEVCYYLADDTIEVKEAHIRNSGRDGPSVFLKRGKLQREFDGMQLPGQQTPQTLLNVLGSNRNVRYCIDPLNIGNKEILYYNQRDLQIGTVLNVYGRSVVITDMDPFTRQYYRDNYGIEQFTPLPMPTRSDVCKPYDKSGRMLPPYNGWGTYEDSAGNCMSIVIKRPKTDFRKFIKFDRYVLRFGAKMLSTIRENCERIFVISYYMSDDTMQVQEVAVRNSGFLGGVFMKRTRVLMPGQEKFTCKQPQYYRPCNFYIGGTMSIKDFLFHLVSADEFTLMYMEHHPDQFTHCNLDLILEKVRKSLEPRMSQFVSSCVPDCQDLEKKLEKRTVFISFESLKGALVALMGNQISDHEIVTLCRRFSGEQAAPNACEREKVRASAHLEIKRALWNGRDELMEHFHHINPTNKPFLSESLVRSTLRGFRMPFTLELIDTILSVLNRNDCDEIEVCDLMNFIDISCSKGCDMPPINYAFELCPKLPFQNKGRVVDFGCLLKALNLPLNLPATNTQPTKMIGDTRILPPSGDAEC
ncbi:PREDICTED: EF-hand domain-containing family member C2 [Drosophila arizonae]|uniref:EF-hand domain-containing family member C2 n=1 Tax=Drosophila arizonae TaxID=7263 RepID=A0ABM1PVU2_DROAR|nr:PREDICTED: EF-hand domain-containing family member C2 [Drosophila arizonae]